MSQVLPERAMGAFSHWSNPNFGGVDPRTGKRWIMYDLIIGGYGGRIDPDGPEAFCPGFKCANIPVEGHETDNPMRVRQPRMLPEPGGEGRLRGCCGTAEGLDVQVEGTQRWARGGVGRRAGG